MRKIRVLWLTLCALTLAACGESQPVEPKQAKAEQGVDLPMPPETDIQQNQANWDMDESYDPLEVKDVNVGDLGLRYYIEAIKFSPEEQALLLLDGTTVTTQYRPILDEDGKSVLDDNGEPLTSTIRVTEYWFRGYDHPCRAGDEVEGTGFVIPEGWTHAHKNKPALANPNLPRGYMPPYRKQPK